MIKMYGIVTQNKIQENSGEFDKDSNETYLLDFKSDFYAKYTSDVPRFAVWGTKPNNKRGIIDRGNYSDLLLHKYNINKKNIIVMSNKTANKNFDFANLDEILKKKKHKK